MINKEPFQALDKMPPEYKSAPFWSWNDKLEPKELVQQIDMMRKQGIGGFFMHPRGGLTDEYMGEDFINSVRHCIREAEKTGMHPWLYDEDRFPSGNAAGRVVSERPEFVSAHLEITTENQADFENDNNILIYFPTTGKNYSHPQLDNGKDAVVFRIVNAPPRLVFNKQGYADLLNKEAVDSYIGHTYERYYKGLGKEIFRHVRGIFTDEPYFNTNEGALSLPWTTGFDEIFRKEAGYDLLPELSKLIFNEGNYRKIRFDYWKAITDLFKKSFTENIYDWCGRHDVFFTGHFYEHSFPSPAKTGCVMPHYEFMHMPGIDMLFNTEEEAGQFGNNLIVKEAASVANQMGGRRALSETYGASGWEMSFSDQKRTIDWLFALGVNFICQHLTLYSIRGYRKRDFPLSFSDVQPWWNEYRHINDHISRLSYLLTQGDYGADILVLHPSGSAWTEYRGYNKNKADARNGFQNDDLKKIADGMQTLLKKLCENHFMYDLGDETIIARHGKAKDGMLFVKKSAYKTVVVPHMTVMETPTFDLLKTFAKSGGNVVSAGEPPFLLDGVESPELKAFFSSGTVFDAGKDFSDLKDYLTVKNSTGLQILDDKSKPVPQIYAHRRINGNCSIVFLCNVSREDTISCRFYLDKPCRIEEWDTVSGAIRERTASEDEDGRQYLKLLFYEAGSYAFVLYEGQQPATAESTNSSCISHKNVITISAWSVKRSDHNALALKLCDCRINGEQQYTNTDVLVINDKIGERLGEQRNIFGLQPWMYTDEDKKRSVKLELEYPFTISTMPCGRLYLMAETGGYDRIMVNGALAFPCEKPAFNRAFRLFDIKNLVKEGVNTVSMESNSHGIDDSVEAIYITGDFAVDKKRGRFVIKPENDSLTVGDWTVQGYPYYSGKMAYEAAAVLELSKDKRVFIELEDIGMVAARLFINGKDAGIIGWKPYKLDITDFVIRGENKIRLEVMNSMQNLLGWHNEKEKPGLATPGSFYFFGGDKRFQKSGFSGMFSITY